MSHQNPPATSMTPRYHYMDNLRALALLIGVIFHAGASYSYIIHLVWPTADTSSSILMDYALWFFHTFRMPLFFLIAGFFAHLLLQKRGTTGFIKHRLLRITLPFVVFWPLMLISMIALFVYAAKHMPVHTFLIDMIRLGMENPEAMKGQKPPLSTTHLWFLYYLSMFCLIIAVLEKARAIGERVIAVLVHPVSLLLVFPLLSTLCLIRKFVPHPAPESIIPEGWALGFFGLFFLVGWALFVRQEILAKFQNYTPWLVISVIVNFGIFAYALPPQITVEAGMAMQHTPPPLDAHAILRVIATGLMAWHASLLCLAWGQRWLNQASAVMRYIADGSYWVYIIHIPVVFYLQLYFHTKELPLLVEFLLISMITLGVGYLSYALLVRHTPIGWWLNGRKKKAPATDNS